MEFYAIPANLRTALMKYLESCPIRDADRIVPLIRALEDAPKAQMASPEEQPKGEEQ